MKIMIIRSNKDFMRYGCSRSSSSSFLTYKIGLATSTPTIFNEVSTYHDRSELLAIKGIQFHNNYLQNLNWDTILNSRYPAYSKDNLNHFFIVL